MKTKITMFLASVFLITGCQAIKDAAEVDFSTQLTANMAITVAGSKSVEITPVANALSFSKSQALDLKDNSEIFPYLEKIREIDITSIMVDIYGINEGQSISTLALDVEGVGTIATITNITPYMNAYPPVIDQVKLGQAAKKLAKELKIMLVVHGEANGPMSFNINMVFPVDVVAGALD
jgi:hypothetical protein